VLREECARYDAKRAKETKVQEEEEEFSTTTDAYGVLHSTDDKPSAASPSGNLKWWHKDGKLHREGDKPAHVAKFPGRYSWARWCRDGKLHRDGGKPASIQIMRDVCVFRWCFKGKACNEDDGPVLVRVERDGIEAYSRIGNMVILEKLEDFEDSDAFGIRAVAKALASATSDAEFWMVAQAMFKKWIE